MLYSLRTTFFAVFAVFCCANTLPSDVAHKRVSAKEAPSIESSEALEVQIKRANKSEKGVPGWGVAAASISTGIGSSLLASFLFWWFFYRKKPKIEISSQIAKQTDDPGSTFYIIKLVNKTSSDIINVKFDLSLAKLAHHSPEAETNIYVLDALRIGRKTPTSELMSINRYDKHDKKASYAIQLAVPLQSDDDSGDLSVTLESLLQEQFTHLIFRVYATHSVSGFSRITQRIYEIHHIKEGRFKPGATVDMTN